MKRNWIRPSALLLLLPGAAWGALATPSTILRQGAGGILDVAETNDKFGYAMTTGNFNGDGFKDLVVGSPGENGSGAVHVLYGSSSGLGTIGEQFFNQSTLSIIGGDQL